MAVTKMVSLSPDGASYIDRLVAEGRFASANDVLEAGLEALRDHDEAIERWLREDVVPVARELDENPSLGLSRRIILSPSALDDLDAIKRYVADDAGNNAAARLVSSLLDACERLADFPERGTNRSDLYPGLRVLGHRRMATFAFRIDDTQVKIIRVLYRGRDVATVLAGTDWRDG